MPLPFCWRRLALLAVLVCMGCRVHDPARKASAELSRRVEVILRSSMNVPPHIVVEVGERTPNEQFPGYDNLAVTFVDGERRMPVQFVISKDDKSLFQMTKYDISRQAIEKKADEMRTIVKKIDLRGRPVRGGQNAQVVIVSFDDLQCPFCTQMHQSLFPTVLNRYGEKIKIVYKDFPLTTIHPWALHAALDSSFLARQNSDSYWDFVDYVHAHQGDIQGHNRTQPEQFADLDKIAVMLAQQHGAEAGKLQSCLRSGDEASVDASLQEGKDLGIDSTPTIFVNGLRVNGTLSSEDVEKIVDRALADAGDTPAQLAPPPAQKQ